MRALGYGPKKSTGRCRIDRRWFVEHNVEFYQLLGGGLKDAGWQREHMSKNRLAILPDLTHYEMFMSPALAATTLPFLAGKSGIGSWAEQVDKN